MEPLEEEKRPVLEPKLLEPSKLALNTNPACCMDMYHTFNRGSCLRSGSWVHSELCQSNLSLLKKKQKKQTKQSPPYSYINRSKMLSW